MNLLLIKDIAEGKSITIRSIASAIEMSDANLHRCIRINQIQAHQLEQIAHILDVSIVVFFDEAIKQNHSNIGHTVKGNGNKVSGDITLSECKSELANLRIKVEEQEKLLNEKERLIQVLMNK